MIVKAFCNNIIRTLLLVAKVTQKSCLFEQKVNVNYRNNDELFPKCCKLIVLDDNWALARLTCAIATYDAASI